MVKGTTTFTAESMLSAPRRSSAAPNPQGTLAVYTLSRYSFATHQNSSQIEVIDINSGQSRLVCDKLGCKCPVWLGWDNQLLWLQDADQGTTELVLGDAGSPDSCHQIVASFDGPVSALKIASLAEDTKALAMTGLATPQGGLYNPEKAEKPKSTARIYTSLYVRHWNSWNTDNTNSIFYASLKRFKGEDGLYVVTTTSLTNALKGHPVSLESPVPPHGGSDNFDISKNGLVFVAKDPELKPSVYVSTNVYYIPLKTFAEAQAPAPLNINTGSLRGCSISPVFSADARSVAFVRAKHPKYWSDKTRLLLLADISDPSSVQEFYKTTDGDGGWDLSPYHIIWNADGKELYITAEENGRVKLWKVPANPQHATELPTPITFTGVIADMRLLPHGKLFVSGSTFVDDSTYTIVDPQDPFKSYLLSSNSREGKSFGIHRDQVSEMWYKGAGDYNVQAWVVIPSNFKKDRKYPLAYIIHGGPQESMLDQWSLRWNLVLFAEQGYVVVAPNFTGSSGYGMAFQNAIQGNWGGRPYLDLVKGFEHIEKNIPYIDTSRAIAAGASYGGYMVNWIQGHPLGRKFRALVTHDGIWNVWTKWASDEQYLIDFAFDGTPWENPADYERWNPACYCANWDTPHLIIHNPNDFRCVLAEGTAAFNVLQRMDVPSKFVSFEGEFHWVLHPENSLVWHREVFGWINKYSGITAEREEARDYLSTQTLRKNFRP